MMVLALILKEGSSCPSLGHRHLGDDEDDRLRTPGQTLVFSREMSQSNSSSTAIYIFFQEKKLICGMKKKQGKNKPHQKRIQKTELD
jgi:hypothetical protein